jgi:hypothetical protein
VNGLDGYVPKSKVDHVLGRDWDALSDAEVLPILYELLEWCRDLNWPVAREVVEVLPRWQHLLVPVLKAVLSSEQRDDEWKYAVVSRLLPRFQRETLLTMCGCLERLASAPTVGEREEDVDMRAREVLEELGM